MAGAFFKMTSRSGIVQPHTAAWQASTTEVVQRAPGRSRGLTPRVEVDQSGIGEFAVLINVAGARFERAHARGVTTCERRGA